MVQILMVVAELEMNGCDMPAPRPSRCTEYQPHEISEDPIALA